MDLTEKQEQKLGCAFIVIIIALAITFIFKILWVLPLVIIIGLIIFLKNRIVDFITEKNLNRNVELLPYDHTVYQKRAEFYIKYQRYSEAINDYSKIVELNTFNPAESHANLAYCYYLQNENKLAIRNYNIAIDYQPKCATWYYYRSLAYINCKTESAYNEALIDLNTAYELRNNPEIATTYQIISNNFNWGKMDIYYHRGLLYSWLDNPNCALKELNLLSKKYKNRNIVKNEIAKCSTKVNSIKEVQKQEQIDYWLNLNGWEYEEAVANVFNNLGYNTTVTKGSGDGGVDIIIEKTGYRAIIQCKHYSYPVPPEPVRALWGCKDEFNAQEVILVATNGVTQSGTEFIDKRDNFKLYTLNDIINLVNSYTNKQNTEYMNTTRWNSTKEAQAESKVDLIFDVKVTKNDESVEIPIEYNVWKKDNENNYKNIHKKLSVKIPKDFKYEDKLRCVGEGNIDKSKNNTGNLYIKLVKEIKISKAIIDKNDIQRELKKFNWGACILPVVWLLMNGLQEILGLLIFIGFILNFLYKIGVPENTGIVLYIITSVILGIYGNKLAYKKDKYHDFEDFKAFQQISTFVCLVITVPLIIVISLIHILN